MQAPKNKKEQAGWLAPNWSRVRESNRLSGFGKPLYYDVRTRMVIDIIADAARNCNPHFEMFSREDEKGFAIPGKICYNIPVHERNEVENVAQKISNSVLKRLPVYLSYLKSLPEDAPENISATTLAPH